MSEQSQCQCPEGFTCGRPDCRSVREHPEWYSVRNGAVYFRKDSPLGQVVSEEVRFPDFSLPDLRERGTVREFLGFTHDCAGEDFEERAGSRMRSGSFPVWEECGVCGATRNHGTDSVL